MKYGLVIVAAGSGKRMNSTKNKLFLTLGDYPILVHTLRVFLQYSLLSEIILVLKEDEIDYCRQNILQNYKIDMEKIKLISGGKTRRESVYCGLQAFSPAINYVIIHDGVRPLVTREIIDNIFSELGECQALTTGVPVKETISIIDKNKYIEKTLNRNKLISVQTPQAFQKNLIMEAHCSISKNKNISDDAGLAELYGHQVKIIEGSYENIKITTPEDIIKAELILKKRDDQNEA